MVPDGYCEREILTLSLWFDVYCYQVCWLILWVSRGYDIFGYQRRIEIICEQTFPDHR